MVSTHDFAKVAQSHGVDLTPQSVDTLQLNITKLCNQACVHCHVDASPRRRESMPDAVVDRCLEIISYFNEIKTVDLTGGAPELHPRFKDIVVQARAHGRQVIVRHNLTVTMDPHPLTGESLQDLPEFFRKQRVTVVSSLPYYQEFFTDKQRGSGVFQKSLASLRLLNERGFGIEGSGLELNLVYNPVGAFLPAAQEALERDYKTELLGKFGITFNRLYALTNMPIHRFKAQLMRQKGYEAYLDKLHGAFNAAAAAGIMCRSMVNVSWDGRLFDCDFNQMLGLEIEGGLTVFDFDPTRLQRRQIAVDAHCFGCTAGAGSSCGGTTA